MPLKYKKKKYISTWRKKKTTYLWLELFDGTEHSGQGASSTPPLGGGSRNLIKFWGVKDYPETFLNGPLKFQMRNLHQIQVSRGRASNTIGVNIDISKSIVKWWIIIHNLSYDGYRNFKH